MNRIKAATLALLIAASASIARAAADPVTVEVKWQNKTFSISTTGVTSATFDIGGFGAYASAFLGNPSTFNGVDGTTLGAPSVVTSTWTNVVGLSYSVLPLGGSASLQIAQTIKTPVPNGIGIRNSNGIVFASSTYNTPYPASNLFTVPVISTSSVIVTPNGVPVSDSFQAQTENPIFFFTNLTSAATLYFSVDYAVPKLQ